MSIKREDDFMVRRKHLNDLTDEELKQRFWDLTEKIVDPLIEMAKTSTSPSIERSVLLRMGFNSLDAKTIVNNVLEAGLLGKGAGHVVLKIAEKEKISVKEAGLAVCKGSYSKEDLQTLFGGGESA